MKCDFMFLQAFAGNGDQIFGGRSAKSYAYTGSGSSYLKGNIEDQIRYTIYFLLISTKHFFNELLWFPPFKPDGLRTTDT